MVRFTHKIFHQSSRITIIGGGGGFSPGVVKNVCARGIINKSEYEFFLLSPEQVRVTISLRIIYVVVFKCRYVVELEHLIVRMLYPCSRTSVRYAGNISLAC
jgi:hypothetical protein